MTQTRTKSSAGESSPIHGKVAWAKARLWGGTAFGMYTYAEIDRALEELLDKGYIVPCLNPLHGEPGDCCVIAR